MTLLCPEQIEFLEHAAQAFQLRDASEALERLVDRANGETSHAKRIIFLSVRCHRCLQHTRGGEKVDLAVTLPLHQWTWLENVQMRSQHPTVSKTLRIICDFYAPLCEKDATFEKCIFMSSAKAIEGGQGSGLTSNVVRTETTAAELHLDTTSAVTNSEPESPEDGVTRLAWRPAAVALAVAAPLVVAGLISSRSSR
jgi:hypothetical protein